MSPFKEFYQTEVMPALQQHFDYKNVMQIPKVDKITLNIGVGIAVQNPSALEDAVEELTLIAGQRAVITRAKRSISAFKIRGSIKVWSFRAQSRHGDRMQGYTTEAEDV